MITIVNCRCASLDILGYLVSQNLHHQAVQTVFYAPMSFFDTTVSYFPLMRHGTRSCDGCLWLAFGQIARFVWERR